MNRLTVRFKRFRKYICVIGVVLVYLMVSLYKLDEIPGEWFGDIDVAHEYINDIARGSWPYDFRFGAGPLPYYLTTPLVLTTPMTYINYKAATVIWGLVGVVGVIYLGMELINFEVGVLAGLLASVSFWYIVWARLGNPHISFVVVLSVWLYICIVKYLERKSLKDLSVGAFVASLGLLVYPATFVFPIVFLIAVSSGHGRKKWHNLIASLICMTPIAILFALSVYKHPGNFGREGYIGMKLFGRESTTLAKWFGDMGSNLVVTMEMFHYRGDGVFRVNVPGSPHLDFVSGVMFLIGIAGALVSVKGRLFKLVLAGLVLIVPAIFPTLPKVEIPNSARTITLLPIVLVMIAYGMWLVGRGIEETYGRDVKKLVMTLIMMAIFLLNLEKYFVKYPENLPNHNAAVGKMIANYIDGLPIDVDVKMGECCWADWGVPEPKSVFYNLRNKMGREGLLNLEQNGFCGDESDEKKVLILSPDDRWIKAKALACNEGEYELFNDKYGRPGFAAIKFNK